MTERLSIMELDNLGHVVTAAEAEQLIDSAEALGVSPMSLALSIPVETVGNSEELFHRAKHAGVVETREDFDALVKAAGAAVPPAPALDFLMDAIADAARREPFPAWRWPATNRKAKRERCKARRRERFAAKRAAALAVWQAEVKARMASARDAMLAEGWTPCPACGVLSLGAGCPGCPL